MAASVTTVSATSGNVIVRFTLCANCSVVVVLSTAPVMSTASARGLVFEFANLQLAVSKVLLVSVSVVPVPTSVVVAVGKVMVFPLLVITGLAIVGAVRVLLVSVSVVSRPTRVAVTVGSVIVFPLLVITGLASVFPVSV